jgi:hypothetical protein
MSAPSPTADVSLYRSERRDGPEAEIPFEACCAGSTPARIVPPGVTMASTAVPTD